MKTQTFWKQCTVLLFVLAGLMLFGLGTESASARAGSKNSPITMSFRNADIQEVFEMLAKGNRINIVLGKDVDGEVSLNLYEMELDDAIFTIAEAAGYGVEKKRNGYMILPLDQLSGFEDGRQDMTVFSYKTQYVKPDKLKKTLAEYISKNGKITTLEENNVLTIKDSEETIARIRNLLLEIDCEPRQVLIEAKILAIVLDDSETFGLDWNRLFSSKGGTGSFGTQGFANLTATGFVASLIDSKTVNFVLNMLHSKGKLHTLSTPKLLALENQEAEVMIGDRQGYRVTTTINQVTTESVEFLESGVILKVTPSVDNQGRIRMRIHPEVSSGAIQDGIPSQNTIQVTTDLLARDGQTIFIGGLIKHSTYHSRNGVPVLGAIPIMGKLFSSTEDTILTTETIILITPHLINNEEDKVITDEVEKVGKSEKKAAEERQAKEVITDYEDNHDE